MSRAKLRTCRYVTVAEISYLLAISWTATRDTYGLAATYFRTQSLSQKRLRRTSSIERAMPLTPVAPKSRPTMHTT